MRPQHLSKSMVPVSVPRGHDGFWEIILKLHGEKGEFSVPDIDGESNVSISPIRFYVKALEAGGFVEAVRTYRENGARVTMFRIAKMQRRTPQVRRDGSIIPDTAEQLLWTAMRNLKSFSAAELRYAATVDAARPITAVAARAFVTRLTHAGYLAISKPSRGRSPAAWRLKPSMDTGPLPPRRLPVRCEAMWDANLKKVVGEIVTREPLP